MDFDPGPGVSNLTSAGEDDIFIQKLDRDGNLLWVKSFGSTLEDRARGVSIDPATKRVLITGSFEGTVDFSTSSSSSLKTSNGSRDVFILILDQDGSLDNIKTFGGNSSDVGYSIAADANGIYTSGTFQGTADFDPGSQTADLSSSGSIDAFVQKLSVGGSFAWVRSFRSSAQVSANSMVIDNAGNVITTGAYRGTVDLDPGSGSDSHTSNGGFDIYIQKMNSDGVFQWGRSIGGSAADRGNSITTDASNNLYVTGHFFNIVDFDPGSASIGLNSAGSADIYYLKLNSAGNYLFASSLGGPGYDVGNEIALDNDNNVFITGLFRETMNFTANQGSLSLVSAGEEDVFIQKIAANSSISWVKAMGGPSTGDVGRSIVIDGSNQIYTAGTFEGTADFDPESGTTEITSKGGRDVFIHKMNQDAVGIEDITENHTISVYPNPTNDQVHISLGKQYNNIKLELRDLTGRTVNSINYSSLNSVILDIPEALGTYFLMIQTDEFQRTIKVLKN